MDFSHAFENNERWVRQKLNLDDNYFRELARGQKPDLLYIGCSDSRVTPELIMSAEPGDIFVHRNMANIIPNDDLNALSVIDYAVNHLEVGHIVVCGHYGCGGVKAAMQTDDLDMLNPWLKHVRDVYRVHKDELTNITDENDRYKRLVELNVYEQCANLLKMPKVQRARKEWQLNLHGWVFDLHSGRLIDLDFDMDALWDELKSIYSLS